MNEGVTAKAVPNTDGIYVRTFGQNAELRRTCKDGSIRIFTLTVAELKAIKEMK